MQTDETGNETRNESDSSGTDSTSSERDAAGTNTGSSGEPGETETGQSTSRRGSRRTQRER
jgi:hypothetical protein